MRVYFTRGGSPVEANSVVVTICIVGVSLAGCVHSSVNKPGTNGRVSYDSSTHSRLYSNLYSLMISVAETEITDRNNRTETMLIHWQNTEQVD